MIKLYKKYLINLIINIMKINKYNYMNKMIINKLKYLINKIINMQIFYNK